MDTGDFMPVKLEYAKKEKGKKKQKKKDGPTETDKAGQNFGCTRRKVEEVEIQDVWENELVTSRTSRSICRGKQTKLTDKLRQEEEKKKKKKGRKKKYNPSLHQSINVVC